MSTTLLKTAKEYVDIDFSMMLHPITKNIPIKKQVNSVKQSILHLMRLKSGDKPFHPEIKSPIYDYMFDNASPIMAVVLEDEVKLYLRTYEPRVRVNSVEVTFPSNNEIRCNISGEIINIKEPFTVFVLIDRIR